MTYGKKKIEVANDLDVAAKLLEQGEKAVKVMINGIAYVVVKEENYQPIDDGSSLIL